MMKNDMKRNETEERSMTKAEEKDTLGRVIAELEEGYVKDILSGVQCEIENAIDSDFGFITLSDRFAEIQEHRQAVDDLKAQERLLKTQIRELTDDKRRLENGINELRSTIRQFARI
jgi:chaperonin cofactor prefoldin